MKLVAPLGWFVNLHFEAEALPELESWLRAIPATVVIDHLGRINAGKGVDQRPFRILLELATPDMLAPYVAIARGSAQRELLARQRR